MQIPNVIKSELLLLLFGPIKCLMLIVRDFVCDKVCTDGEKKGKQFEVLFEKW